MPKGKITVFVDFDFTLFSKFLWQALFAHHIRNRFKRLAIARFVAFHFPIWLATKLGILPLSKFYTIHATNLAWLMAGVTADRADEIWDWVIENEIIGNLRPEMLARIKEHKRLEHRIVIISGSFLPLLERLARRMQLDAVIATPLASKNGRYTGEIEPPLNIGEGKLQRLMHYLENTDSEIELADSFFYTDSIIDLPVLELFGHPIAVFPDAELAQIAKTRDWPIIS